MPELKIKISNRDRREIAALARVETGRGDGLPPVSDEQMASALLQAYLILIRDCGGILPGNAPRIKGRGGVTLSGGVNVSS
ncbi:MAG: hypothetical protein EpisKO_06030 [Epibacterium sp.]